MKARHEYKLSINKSDYTILRSRLRATMRHDGNVNKNGEYIIRSLYFDTPRDKALREKIDGVNRREKFRLRLYNGNPSLIRLEKKSKDNNLCYKRQEDVTSREVKKLLQGDYDWMADKNRPLVTELYSKIQGELLRPKIIVEYVREPFAFPAGNVRITIDRGIRTGVGSTDFLKNKFPSVPAGDDIILMEIKYDAFLPDFIKRLIYLDGRRAEAFSKYAAARIYG